MRIVLFVLFILLVAGALLFVARAPFAEHEPAHIALLIGNQSYEPSVGVLKNPHNDIALVSRSLERQGYQVLPLVKDATRVQILAAVRDLARRLNAAGSGAVGFLYYSGHGAAEAETRRNYLIPIDAKRPGTESFWDESVKLDDVLGLLNSASAAAKFVVFDACRNELRLPYRGSKGFVPVREQPGIYVAYTTAPGEPASDDGETSGPYAAAFAAEFAKPGLDHLSLFQNVKEAVYAATRGAQQPWATDGLVRRVYLTGQPRPELPKPAPQKPDEAALAWAAVQNTSSEAVLEEFARRFPESVYTGFAKARLQELRAGREALNVPKPDSGREKPQDRGCPDGLLVSVATAGVKPCIKPGSGESFKDCPDCPEMVIVPSGSFTIGSPKNEPERDDDEGPQHEVTIPKPFAVGKFAVTFAEWDACVAAGGCGGYKPDDQGWGRGDRPVINVSWNDVKAYVTWLSKKTGAAYRLLSEAEREYAARAGTATPFWWGSSITSDQANYDGNSVYAGGGSKGEYRAKTAPVNSFKPNPWGLYQVHGNVWEWVEDCWHDNYSGSPPDSSAWTSGACSRRVLRGGSWYDIPRVLRAARRRWGFRDFRLVSNGFRLARTLNP